MNALIEVKLAISVENALIHVMNQEDVAVVGVVEEAVVAEEEHDLSVMKKAIWLEIDRMKEALMMTKVDLEAFSLMMEVQTGLVGLMEAQAGVEDLEVLKEAPIGTITVDLHSEVILKVHHYGGMVIIKEVIVIKQAEVMKEAQAGEEVTLQELHGKAQKQKLQRGERQKIPVIILVQKEVTIILHGVEVKMTLKIAIMADGVRKITLLLIMTKVMKVELHGAETTKVLHGTMLNLPQSLKIMETTHGEQMETITNLIMIDLHLEKDEASEEEEMIEVGEEDMIEVEEEDTIEVDEVEEVVVEVHLEGMTIIHHLETIMVLQTGEVKMILDQHGEIKMKLDQNGEIIKNLVHHGIIMVRQQENNNNKSNQENKKSSNWDDNGQSNNGASGWD